MVLNAIEGDEQKYGFVWIEKYQFPPFYSENFAVRRGDISTPNSADILVYNSDKTASKIQKEFTRVRLEAGYEENYGLIFDGTVIQVRRGRESQTDTYLAITAADGDRAFNFAVMNKTLVAGSTFDDHLSAVMEVMGEKGVTDGYQAEMPKRPLPRGKVMFGAARQVLDAMVTSCYMKWSIQDGKMTVIPLTNYIPGNPVVITSATGMIGMPEQTIGGINVQMLLNPLIKIGRLLKIDNASIQQYRHGVDMDSVENRHIVPSLDADGLYYIMVANCAGDTHGTEWYTNTVCLSVDPTWIPEPLLDDSISIGPVPGPVKAY